MSVHNIYSFYELEFPQSETEEIVKIDIKTLTMEKYLGVVQNNHRTGMIRPEIGRNVNFEIKSQFLRELKDTTFSENKDKDAYEHVDKVLEITSLFNIPGILKDVIILWVFPITLTSAAKRWMRRVPAGTINTWDLLKKAWERYDDLLYKCPTHNLNNYQNVSIFYNELEIPTRQMLGSRGPIPRMTATKALIAIQEMADHSQKWHDKGSIRSLGGSRSDKISVIINKLNDIGYDMRKLKESVHAIQIGESIDRNLKRHDSAIKGLEKKVKQLARVGHSSMTNDSKSINQDKSAATKSERKETPKSTSVNGTFTDKVKRRIVEEQEKIPANELPPKEKDSGSFFLPCIIGNMAVSNALADLGASISIMPFSLFKRLGLGKPKPIRMLIEMADKSMQSPKGIIKNILVKIDRFISPVDFVILDIVEDDKVPIILGRPMLAIAHRRMPRFNVWQRKIVIGGLIKRKPEEFLMNMKVNGDFGDLLNLTISLPVISVEPFGVLLDSESEIEISRFCHLSTQPCNMMVPILRISDEDKANGFDHAHQKIKEFYKGCLQLGDEYKMDEKVIEWITHEHASIHDMM
ncbi:hypothetical protein Tco_0606993 [Tanacetum coccineum]